MYLCILNAELLHQKNMSCTDLSQSALQASQEVIIIEAAGGIVNVIHHELELLHLLKTVLHLDNLAELRV